MGRSFSLAAYRILSRRKPLPRSETNEARPDGELLWCHATSPERLEALCDIVRRLRAQRPGLRVLITLNRDAADAQTQPECDMILPLGSDDAVAVGRFLDHWRPDICVWTGGDLMPNLIAEASGRGLPMILLDISEDEVPTRRHRWLPDPARATLDCFDTIMTRDEATAVMLRRSGVAADKITATARLRPGASPPSCRETDLTSANHELIGRSVWLAVAAQAGEFETILAAHRIALRLVHRLLLIVTPADPENLEQLKLCLSDSGLRFGDWDGGDHIGEETQALLSTNPVDLGLWYRVAPLCFVASTFESGPGGRSPLEATALGSAVLHGPDTGNFRDAFASLAAAGAAREVRDADQLGAAVTRLVAPDQAARMALAGWEVVTEGAGLADRLIDLVQDMLDLQESTRAGA